MLSVVFALLFAFSAINACQYEGYTKNHGETWVVDKPNSGGSWVMKCEMPSHNEYKVFLAGCVTPLRNKVMINEHYTEGDFTYSCTKDHEGFVQLKSARRGGSGDPY